MGFNGRLSAYVLTAGVIAFWRERERKAKTVGLTKAIVVFGIMAYVPILNSSLRPFSMRHIMQDGIICLYQFYAL